MRRFQFKNDVEVFTLKEIINEFDFTDEEVNKFADMQVGGEYANIQRIADEEVVVVNG
jgi:hypothetical protein